MDIYVLTIVFKGISEPPQLFGTERQAKAKMKKMEKYSGDYDLKIWKHTFSLKLKGVWYVDPTI